MTNELLTYLIATVFNSPKEAPPSVWEAVYRQFYVDSLQDADISFLEDISYEALKALWKKTFWDEKIQKFSIRFDPTPSIFSFRPCYLEIFYGICGLQATIYKGTPTYFSIQNTKGKVLKRIEDNKL